MSVGVPLSMMPPMMQFQYPHMPSAGFDDPGTSLAGAPIPPYMQGMYSGYLNGGQSIVPAAVPRQEVKKDVQQQRSAGKSEPSTGGVGSPYPLAVPERQQPTYRQPPRTKESWQDKDFIRHHCVPKKSVGNDLRPLSDQDDYYFDTVTAPQRVYLRFKTALNTKRLVKALDKAMLENPMAASKVVMANGKRHYHCNSVDTKLTTIMVDRPVFNKYHDISFICERLSDDQSLVEQMCFFYLFRSPDPKDGCIIVAHFEHTLGDAAVYSKLMTSWSRNYARSSGFFGFGNGNDSGELPDSLCTPGDMLRGTPMGNQTSSSFSMRYYWTPAAVRKMKSSILSGGDKEGITINDILLAQTVIALGQKRRDPSSNGPRDRDYAYISVIADTRGRKQGVERPDEFWGNHATDLAVFIPWTMLQEGASVHGVARVIRECIKSELKILAASYDQFETHRLNCAKNKMLMCWNTWYKAGSEMCGADFGSKLIEFEWLNTYHHMGAEVALVNTSLAMMGKQGVGTASIDCTGRGKSGVDKGAYMYVQMALKDEEEARLLSEMWPYAVALKVPRV